MFFIYPYYFIVWNDIDIILSQILYLIEKIILTNGINKIIMQITRVSALTSITHTKEINVTQEQLDKWQDGMHIQNAMPNISPEDREFIMSGITPEEWRAHFPEDEYDDEEDDWNEEHVLEE